MGGGNERQHQLAERERRLAEARREESERWDRRRQEHLRAMRAHERAAEIHDALATFEVSEQQADDVNRWIRRVTYGTGVRGARSDRRRDGARVDADRPSDLRAR